MSQQYQPHRHQGSGVNFKTITHTYPAPMEVKPTVNVAIPSTDRNLLVPQADSSRTVTRSVENFTSKYFQKQAHGNSYLVGAEEIQQIERLRFSISFLNICTHKMNVNQTQAANKSKKCLYANLTTSMYQHNKHLRCLRCRVDTVADVTALPISMYMNEKIFHDFNMEKLGPF